MRMVGRSRGLVHRRYKPKSKRWMYQPKHKEKLNLDGLRFFFDVSTAFFAMVLTVGFLWLYFG